MNIKELNNKLMYKDRVEVYRYEKVKNPDGSTTQKLKLVPDIQDEPCKLSIKTADNPEPSDDVNSLKVIYTLFTDNSLVFKKGDFIKVTKTEGIYKLIAGNPIIYAYHQEIPCIQKEWA